MHYTAENICKQVLHYPVMHKREQKSLWAMMGRWVTDERWTSEKGTVKGGVEG